MQCNKDLSIKAIVFYVFLCFAAFLVACFISGFLAGKYLVNNQLTVPCKNNEIILDKAKLIDFVRDTSNKAVSQNQAIKIVESITLSSEKHGVNPVLVFAVASVESKFKARAKSKAGAVGVMQVMPKIHKKKFAGRNVYAVETNIDVGVKVLKDFKQQYKTLNLALLGYNGSLKQKHQTYHTKVLGEMQKLESILKG